MITCASGYLAKLFGNVAMAERANKTSAKLDGLIVASSL
jgi:hypothetical protein